jgi:hypothetical protein
MAVVMRAFLQKHLDDILIVAGCIVLAFATWQISPIGAAFLVGVELIVLGVLAGVGGEG